MAEKVVVLDNTGNEVPAPPSAAKAPTRAQAASALAEPAKQRAFDPLTYSLSARISDPVFLAARNIKWSDRQQHGRLAYDTMYKHPAVAAAFDTKVAFLKSYDGHFRPQGTSPNDLQKQLAAYANAQIARLGASGDPRQGFGKFMEWIGQGLKYGFAIAEMEAVRAPWGGQSRVQIGRILPLPQASLDGGFVPFEEFGQGMMSPMDPRYNCFDLTPQGDIAAVFQYYRNTGPNGPFQVKWEGAELLRLLIFTHGGGEGNPHGQSDFFSAFYAWAALYTVEQMEEAFLNASLPYLTISYKAPDGRPSPAYHAEVLKLLSQQDPALRALIGPDTTFGSTAPSNPSFTEHATRKKGELRSYIRECIFGAHLTGAGDTKELDARNTIQVFFKYILPALQQEVSTLLTWQFGKRLIDANWSNLSQEDYPVFGFDGSLDNDLRVSTPLLQQTLPFVDDARMGEFLQKMIPGFDAGWIPKDPARGFAQVRGAADPAAGATGSNTPPTKQQGSNDARSDGQSGNLGADTNTAV